MTVYSSFFAVSEVRSRTLLGILQLTEDEVGEFRDVWVEKSLEGPVVVVYARNGGAVGREAFARQVKGLREHWLYLGDAEDAFEGTYASYRFRAPQDDPAVYAVLEQFAGTPINTAERWLVALHGGQQ